MRRIRIAGLCLVAAFAMSVIASATASAALPEYGRCLKKATVGGAGFADAKCIKKKTSGAKYEFSPGFVAGSNKFTSTGGTATLQTKSGKTVTCTKEESTGTYVIDASNKHEETTVLFKGCTSSGFKCTTTGKATGELETNPLVGEVGFKTKPSTALKLEPGPTAANKFIEFKCVGLEIKVRGKGEVAGAGILVGIKNDVMANKEVLKYTQSAGVQTVTKWEGPNPETFLESSFEKLPYEQSGQTVTSTVKNVGGVKYELKAK